MVNAALVRTLFRYDQATGDLIRLTAPTYKNKVGDIAGCVNVATGYRTVKIRCVGYPAHRLVWLHVHGVWPAHEIDHINGNKLDNRIENLRDVPHQVNVQNLRESTSSSSTGILGVGPHGDRWRARILLNGRTKYLGRFKTKEQAMAAYVAAKRELHFGCTL
jgi:hypothetical protein